MEACQIQACTTEKPWLKKLSGKDEGKNNLNFPFPLPSKIPLVCPLCKAARSQLTADTGKCSLKRLSRLMRNGAGQENRLGAIGPRTGTVCHQRSIITSLSCFKFIAGQKEARLENVGGKLGKL